ncbi:MAG: hypothetical protein IJR67_02145 [Acholeplasmatales bacterium]|nr:hypothetical protein [Acholeplasmatales bacterium]
MSTSLQKSHSKASNFKLTLICLLTALFNALLWTGVAMIFIPMVPSVVAYITLGVGVAGSVLFFLLIGKFSRG